MFVRCLLLMMFFFVPGSGAAPENTADETAIVRVLEDSVAGWNTGDLASFMAAYHESDDLRFASGGNVSFGWSTVLERYRLRYPDRAAMGELVFSGIDVTILGPEAALAFGRWQLIRDADKPQGLFSLVLRRFPEGWRIVHDHTSSAD